jgi:hypothetical protein
MKRFLLLAILIIPASLFGQGFEVVSLQETYKGLIGETVKAPVRFKNTTDKAITLIIRKVNAQIGSTQRSFYCLGNDCFDSKVEDYIVKVEPGQTLSSFQVALEAGLVPGISTLKYLVYNKSLPGTPVEFDINFMVDEKPEKQTIYTSKDITINDVYPNPIIENAYIDYRLLSDQVKAKIIVHDILGNIVGEYPLIPTETLIRIKAEELTSGIYFYTLYVNNKAMTTRKIMMRRGRE